MAELSPVTDAATEGTRGLLKALSDALRLENGDSFQRLMTMLRRGGVMTLLFLLFITGAAINLSHGIAILRRHYDQVTSDVLDLLAAKQERRRGETEVGVVQAALSALQGRQIPNGAQLESKNEEYLTQLVDRFLARLASPNEAAPALRLELRKAPEDSTSRHGDFGPLAVLSTDASTLAVNPLELVPVDAGFVTLRGEAQVLVCREQDAGPCTEPLLTANAWQVIRASSVIEDVPLPADVAAVYLISPDEVLRYRTSSGPGRAILDFPAVRRWSDASYFARLVDSREASSATAPYIDFAGHGIVMTRCRAALRDNRLVAGICIDEPIKAELLMRSLAAQPGLLHAELMLLDDRFGDPVAFTGALPVVPASAVGDSDIAKFLAGTMVHGVDRSDELTRAIRTVKPSALSRTVTRGPLRIDVNGNTAFFLRLAGGDLVHRGLLVRPGLDFPPRAKWDLLLALACVLAAALCAARAVIVAKVRGEALVLSNLLRNIEIGVVFVDRDERIVAANDRAEEILGVPLPRIGAWLDLDFQRVVPGELLANGADWLTTELFEEKVYIAEPGSDGGERSHAPAETLREATLGRVFELRRMGLSSSYFAKLRLGRATRWVRISGAPVPTSGGANNSRLQTVGLITPVDKARVDWIEKTAVKS